MSDLIKKRLDALNSQQYEAVTHTDGPLLILAGAGSGKTHVLISRAAYLVSIGVAPESILLLAFTNKAADEMKKRAKEISELCEGITACTYHSFCVNMLRKYAEQAGLPHNFTVISQQDSADILNMLKAAHEWSKLRGFPKAKTIASIISASRNRDVPIDSILLSEKYLSYVHYVNEITTLAKEYKKYKEEHYMLDYDDLLVRFYELIRDNERVRRRISDRYEYIMVDEYQDTNIMQDKIILTLRNENRNIAVVGDDSQSIYKFRGAEVHNFIDFPQRMEGCRIVKLERNYRSNQEILDLANYIMKKHATEGFKKTMRANHRLGKKPGLVYCMNQNSEAKNATDIIKRIRRSGTPLNEIAVVYRSSFQAITLESLLNMESIPYVKYGGIKFLEMSFVLDVIMYLRVIVNPYDEVAWHRILSLYEGIGPIYAHRLASLSKEKGAKLLIENNYTTRAFYKHLKDLYENYQLWFFGDDCIETINLVIKHYEKTRKNAIDHMVTSDESNRDEAYRTLNKDIQELALFPSMAEESGSIAEFLDNIMLDRKRKEEDEEDRLVLSTIHSIKGLEFDTVIILDCVDGICPTTREGDEEDDEELRCFYVAVTRAKRNLYLMYPAYVVKFNKREKGELSHYLDDYSLFDTTY